MDNQPQSFSPTPNPTSGATPPPTPNPALTPPPDPGDRKSARKRLIILIPALAVLIIIGIVIGAMAFSGSDPKPATKTSNQPKFDNLLTPTSEIKVGDARYISPCQVFPLSTASKFGKADDSTMILEDGLAMSRAKTGDVTADRVRTSCGYKFGEKFVYLRAEQHANPIKLKDIASVFLRQSDSQQIILNGLKQTTANSNNSDAKKLIQTYEKSLTTFKQYEEEYDMDVLEKVDFNGMMLTAYGAKNMQLLHNNVVYELQAAVPVDKASVSQLASIQQAYDEIIKRVNDKSLDQSPAPTILGTRDTIGSTKILEPCVILSMASFQAITGKPNSGLLTRSTLPVNANKDQFDKRSNKRILEDNSCERLHEGGKVDTRMTIRMYQAKTDADATQFLKDYASSPSTQPSALQTNADEAMILASPIRPQFTQYLFRVGPYVVNVDYETQDSTSGNVAFTNASEDQFVGAINALTAAIKQQQ